MKNRWAERLWEVIDADPRTDRALSLAAGLGPNYLQQTRTRGTHPVSDKLNALLDQLGEEAAIYVMTGVKLNKIGMDALNTLADVPEPLRDQAMGLLKAIPAQLSPQLAAEAREEQEVDFHDLKGKTDQTPP